MSRDEDNIKVKEGGSMNHCANCGVAEIDDVKLKDCPQCDLAKYCGDDCQQDHLEKHEAICKERAAELRDDILFRQNESSFLGDCPICFLPLPFDDSKFSFYFCCCQVICKGCAHANQMREMEARLKCKCPFCRKPIPKTVEEGNKILMKRAAAANDPEALRHIGWLTYEKGNYDSAFEYWKRAAELGDAAAHNNLADMYRNGEGVEKEEKMAIYHWEEAAIAGDPKARHNVGVYEYSSENVDRAVKHWIIAANLGHDESLQKLKGCYKVGLVSKDDFAAALRAHHTAVSATKSPQREAAATAQNKIQK